MTTVLTIEDDEITAKEIIRELTHCGFTVDWASTGREGMSKVMIGNYDAVMLDRMLPDIDGLTILRTMRGVGMETPVLMLSALSDADERVRGLRAGGDDYLTKPFASHEMSARLEILLRRHQRSSVRETRLHVGSLELDLVSRQATCKGVDIPLLPTEFRVLEFMMRNAGQVLTRTMIFEAVWGYRFDPGSNLIDVHVGRLRKKMDANEITARLLRTVRGSGYILG
jgi:two-component system OmpR family response regulator